MTEESNSQAGRTPTEKPVRRTKFSLVRVLVTALICFMILYVFLLPAIFDARSPQPGRVSCLANLKGLGSCLALYAYDYNDVYPPAERWCDAIVDAFGSFDSGVENLLRCPRAKIGPCNYALNPNAGPRQARDVVLLFESKPGWNQSGGPGLLTTENHQGKGCSIVFADLHVEFVKTEDLGRLKWTYDDANMPGRSVTGSGN
jgi:prepilin-type processing-associated H-X9-DG protein